MKQFHDLALFLPTLNNMPDIVRHLEHLEPLLHKFSEIIVVDSFSDDGSFEYLKQELSKFNTRLVRLVSPPSVESIAPKRLIIPASTAR